VELCAESAVVDVHKGLLALVRPRCHVVGFGSRGKYPHPRGAGIYFVPQSPRRRIVCDSQHGPLHVQDRANPRTRDCNQNRGVSGWCLESAQGGIRCGASSRSYTHEQLVDRICHQNPRQRACTDEVGSLWWVEVLSNDVAAARDFYGLGGPRSTCRLSRSRRTPFRRGEVQEGGLLPIGRDWEVSPRWNAIFAVSDCDATMERATSLDGSTIFVHTVPKYGRIGSLCDAGGATFLIRGPVTGGQTAA